MGDEDIYHALGRIEEGITQLKESAKNRDDKLGELTERVRQNEHGRRNEAQIVSGRIDRIEASGKRLENGIGDAKHEISAVSDRVQKLELPVQIALARRTRNQKIVIRLTAWITAAIGIAWVVLDPIYKPIAEYFVRKYMGQP